MGAECLLCKNNNNLSRLREKIERTGTMNSMTEAAKIATNTDNKGNNMLMHSILARTRIGSNATISIFTQMHELVFEMSFINKNDFNMNKSKHVCQENHSMLGRSGAQIKKMFMME